MMSTIPVDTLREACLQLASWLEGRHFAATVQDGADLEVARVAAAAWTEGYRRAIFELRWAAREPVVVPDDISELDGP